MEPQFKIKGKLWRYQADKASWIFLTVDKNTSSLIKGFQGKRRGFGSVRVEVRLGESLWKTSIFPDKTGVYFLPIKKQIRESEGIKEGDPVEASLMLI